MLRATIQSKEANWDFPSNTGQGKGRFVQVTVTFGSQRARGAAASLVRTLCAPSASVWWFVLPSLVFCLALGWLYLIKHRPAGLITNTDLWDTICAILLSPEYWILIPVTLIFAIVMNEFHRRRLDPIKVYLLSPDEPFPVLQLSITERKRHIFAIRILGPNLDKKLRQYSEPAAPIYIDANEPPEPRPDANLEELKKILRRTTKEQREAAENFWPLIRVAIDRTLYKARHEDFKQAGGLHRSDVDPPHRTPKHPWYFMYTMHVPQIAGFVILVAVAAVLFAFSHKHSIDHAKDIAAVGLAVAATVWCLYSIYLHRKQYRHLHKWAQKWSDNPFASNAVFYYQQDNSPNERWEELMPTDFNARIEEFGIDNSRLLDSLIAFLLIGYFTLLAAVR